MAAPCDRSETWCEVHGMAHVEGLPVCVYCDLDFDPEDGSWGETCERDHCTECWSLCPVCTRVSYARAFGV